LGDGELIEIATHGASLRAWVKISPDINPESIGLDADGLSLVGANGSEFVTVRRVGSGHD
jgi:hypothetical protein